MAMNEKIYITTHVQYQIYKKNYDGKWRSFGLTRSSDQLLARKKMLQNRKDIFKIIRIRTIYEEVEF